MAQSWYLLSLVDGSLVAAKSPKNSKPVRWIERDLENILSLNPNILQLEDHYPVRLQGVRGTVSSPDQAYIDELGRVIIVEVKKIESGLSVIAQVLAYADHWRLLPPGELNPSLRNLSNSSERSTVSNIALEELRKWAKTLRDIVVKSDKSNLKAVDGNIRWPTSSTIKQFAQDLCKSDRMPALGAPARMIVLAPGFRDECTDFAEKLGKRMVGIELVEVEIVRSSGNLYIGLNWVHRNPSIEPTWQLFRKVWSEKFIRDGFDLNGWADALNYEAFSLSSKSNSEIRFWIWAEDDCAGVYTAVPSRWFAADLRKRKDLRDKLLAALPVDFEASGGWLNWEFETKHGNGEILQCVIDVAKAVQSVLLANDLGTADDA